MRILMVLALLFVGEVFGAVQWTPNDIYQSEESLKREQERIREEEKWKQYYALRPEKRPLGHCFTCDVRVLTSRGYRAIGEIKIGESVLSFDPMTGKLIENNVVEVHEAQDQEVYEVASEAVNGQLRATLEHPFYEALTRGYIPLREWKRSGRLLHVEASCETFLQPIDSIKPVGKALVKTLSVEKHPHNFIVEGVLVHNKPIRWPAG